MLDALKLVGFLFLFSRFLYWVGASMNKPDTYTPRVFLGQLTEGLLLLFFFGQFFAGRHILPFSQNIVLQVLGLGMIALGVVLAFLAKWQLRDEWVHASSYKNQKGKHVATKGVYSVIRHPIYTGILLSYLGAELLAGSWLWIAMLCMIIPFFIQAKKEETFLVKIFDKQYKNYIQKTSMFIPFIF